MPDHNKDRNLRENHYKCLPVRPFLQLFAHLLAVLFLQFAAFDCLVEQQYVIDGDLTVGKYVEKTAKELGADIKIASFVRFEKGEGIEKRVDDFAAEVAGMVK